MRFFSIALAASVAISSACFNPEASISRPNKTISVDSTKTSFYDYKVNSLMGEPVDLSQYKGRKIVVMNVASKCGYTPQYADWEAFYKKHGDKVVVLGFPCNDFMGQEPGSAEDIAQFCEKNYGVTFPLFEKVHVKGKDQAPIYQWLTDPAMNGWNDQKPSWNFCKYIINEKGELTHFFASKVKPGDAEFLKAVGIEG
jgi:glutathione peroxidase